MKSKKSGKRITLLAAFVTITMVLSLVSFNTPAVAADYYDYTYYEGSDQGDDVDPVIASLINGLNKVTFDAAGNPEGDANGAEVILSDSFTFSWSSVKKVKFLYVKVGTGGIIFDYGGASSGSIDLIQIYDDNDVEYYEMSYISFYFCSCPITTPTPTPEEPTPTPTPEQPTPTPTPEEPTPTPTPEEPTPTPTPEEPTPTPTPEQPPPTPTSEITPDPIPGSGTITPEDSLVNSGEEPLPAAPATLPKTGGIPAGVFYGLGAVIVLGGLLIRRK